MLPRAKILSFLGDSCEADPEILADYVAALLRNDDKPRDELRATCIAQLEDFLREDTVPFVDKLFEALGSQNERDGTAVPPAVSVDTAGSTGAAALTTLQDPPHTRASPTSDTRPDGRRNSHSTSAWGDSTGGGAKRRRSTEHGPDYPSAAAPSGSGDYQRHTKHMRYDPHYYGGNNYYNFPPQIGAARGPRDFRDRGRPYRSGADNWLDGSASAMRPPIGGGGGFFVPHIGINIGAPGGQNYRVMERGGGRYRGGGRGAVMNNNSTYFMANNSNTLMNSVGGHLVPENFSPFPSVQRHQPPDKVDAYDPANYGDGRGNAMPLSQPTTIAAGIESNGIPMPMDAATGETASWLNYGVDGAQSGVKGLGFRGSRRPGFRGRGRGSNSSPGFAPYAQLHLFSHHNQQHPSQLFSHNQYTHHTHQQRQLHGRPKYDTIVVDNIPDEHCSTESVKQFFQRFGTIVNIQINLRLKKAMIQFSSHEEAKVAYNSPEPVFSNRFVKVYFIMPQTVEPAGNAGQPGGLMKPDQPPLLDPDSQNQPQTTGSVDTKLEENQKQIRAMLELQKQKEILIQKQIEYQKKILEKLEKKSLSAKDRALLLDTAKTAEETARTTLSSAVTTSATVMAKVPSAKLTPEVMKKELLDRELDSMKNALNGASADADPALQAKLEELKVEAIKLGVDPVAAIISGVAGSSVERGRGRGRSRAGWRGRSRGAYSGVPRNFNLDNRTTKILLHDVPPSSRPDILTQLQECGELISLVFDDSALTATAQFRLRWDAEKAIAKGFTIEGKSLRVAWIEEPAGPIPVLTRPEEIKPHTATPLVDDELDDQYDDEEDEDERGWKHR